jgi:hypothetical protein
VSGRRYRVASQSLWDSAKQRPFARQAVLGAADPPPVADLALTRTVGTRRVGDVGTLEWVAEQLNLIKFIDQARGVTGPSDGPTIGDGARRSGAAGLCARGQISSGDFFWKPPVASYTVSGASGMWRNYFADKERWGRILGVSWGPSHQWTDSSLRLHMFATVILAKVGQ